MKKHDKIYIAGRGMVGQALIDLLQERGFENVISPTHAELDLVNQADVNSFFEREQPDYVFLAAAKVGGVAANLEAPADFLYENLMIEMNVINAAYRYGVKRLELIASAAVYPRDAEQPLKESSLLTGAFEPSNEAYGLAKTAGIRYCAFLNKQYGTSFFSVTPMNLFGPNDNYDPERSHVLPGMIYRFNKAKDEGADKVVVWGTGTPVREFLYSKDMADACLLLMERYEGDGPVNVGTGQPVSIRELAETVRDAVGFEGDIAFDVSKPDGAPKRTVDITILKDFGWEPTKTLAEGVVASNADYLAGHVRASR